MVLSCRKSIGGIAGGRAGCAAAAAIFGEVGQQLVHRAVLGRIDELPAQAALCDQAGMDELREMERKRGRFLARRAGGEPSDSNHAIRLEPDLADAEISGSAVTARHVRTSPSGRCAPGWR